MLTDVDKEFDTPELDENGELIETIEIEEVFEDDTGLEEKEDSFYELAEDDITQEVEEFNSIEEDIVSGKENYEEAKQQLVDIFTSILEKGEITAEDNIEIEQVKEQYSEAYNSIKENTENVQKKTLEERLEELKEGMVGATTDDILNILTEGGTKCWLYKDDDGNVLMDGTAIPELTVLLNKLNLIATDGENEGEIQLSPGFINMLATSAIVFTAANINLNGYISNDGGNFALDQQGNLEVQDLSVKGEFSCESLTVDTLNSPKFPPVLDGSMNISINATNGNDEAELDEGAVFATLSGALNKIPKNLNGKTINISLKSNITDDVSVNWFMCGRIRVYFEGHTLYGYYRTYRCNCAFETYGGTTDNPEGLIGILMPNKGYSVAGISSSASNTCTPDAKMYNMKIYAATNLASGCTESAGYCCSDNGYTYIRKVTTVNCIYGFRANAHGKLHSDSSGGKGSKYGFAAVSGAYITLSNGQHTGGTTADTYENSGGKVIPGSGATFVGTAESGTNTSTGGNTTKTVTYTSNSGDTWRTTYNSWRKESKVIEGNGYGSGNCRGYWFFGTQFAELKGCTINKVVLKVKRAKLGSWGSSSTLKLAYHGYSTKPSSPSAPTYFKSVAIGAYNDTYVSYTITDADILAGIKAGTIKGFGLYDSSYGTYVGCSGTAKVTITYTE